MEDRKIKLFVSLLAGYITNDYTYFVNLIKQNQSAKIYNFAEEKKRRQA